MTQPKKYPEEDWNQYWAKVRVIGLFANLYRKTFLSRPMSKMIEKYFPTSGVFLEAGCGSATDTFHYEKKDRKFIAMDISRAALELAIQQKNIDEAQLGDICYMNFPDNHFDGIWNLGVMEHFVHPDMAKAFSEMRRVLKPGAHVILLWPSVWNLVNAFLWWLFPKMPSLLRSRRQGMDILQQNHFHPCEATNTVMGDIILVGRKT
jgi:SAM-dependent methyltransferase